MGKAAYVLVHQTSQLILRHAIRSPALRSMPFLLRTWIAPREELIPGVPTEMVETRRLCRARHGVDDLAKVFARFSARRPVRRTRRRSTCSPDTVQLPELLRSE